MRPLLRLRTRTPRVMFPNDVRWARQAFDPARPAQPVSWRPASVVVRSQEAAAEAGTSGGGEASSSSHPAQGTARHAFVRAWQSYRAAGVGGRGCCCGCCCCTSTRPGATQCVRTHGPRSSPAPAHAASPSAAPGTPRAAGVVLFDVDPLSREVQVLMVQEAKGATRVLGLPGAGGGPGGQLPPGRWRGTTGCLLTRRPLARQGRPPTTPDAFRLLPRAQAGRRRKASSTLTPQRVSSRRRRTACCPPPRCTRSWPTAPAATCTSPNTWCSSCA
jgi:hypothetical protein